MKSSPRHARRNLAFFLLQASVEDLVVNSKSEGGGVGGVILGDGCKIRGSSTVLTTGTFLRGMIHMGR
jgi:tRNA uridine 5-carboxymethylaminomethyl modification enzyme